MLCHAHDICLRSSGSLSIRLCYSPCHSPYESSFVYLYQHVTTLRQCDIIVDMLLILRLCCDSQHSTRFHQTPRHAHFEPGIVQSASAPAVRYAQPLLAGYPTRPAQSNEGRQDNCDLPLENEHDNRRDNNRGAIVALTRGHSLINKKLDVDFTAVQDVSTIQAITKHATYVRPRAPCLYTLTFDYQGTVLRAYSPPSSPQSALPFRSETNTFPMYTLPTVLNPARDTHRLNDSKVAVEVRKIGRQGIYQHAGRDAGVAGCIHWDAGPA